MQTFLSDIFIPLFLVVVGYVSGSIPSGVLYSKIVHKKDVRTMGSGNSGATNIGRNFGFKAAVIVSILDVLKGLIPVLIAKIWFPTNHLLIIGVAFACVLGHSYPIFAGFRGGKIVATSIGVLIAFDIRIALIMIAMFAFMLFITSTVSLSSIVSYSLTALLIAFTNPVLEYRIGFIIMALFLIYRHRSNVHRLLTGTESRINWGLKSPKKNK